MAPVAVDQVPAVTNAKLKDVNRSTTTVGHAIDSSVLSRPNLALWVTQDHRQVENLDVESNAD